MRCCNLGCDNDADASFDGLRNHVLGSFSALERHDQIRLAEITYDSLTDSRIGVALTVDFCL